MKSPSPWQVSLILTIGVLAVSMAAIFIRLSINAANTSGVEFSLFLAASRLMIASGLLIPTWRNFPKKSGLLCAYYYAMGAGVALACHFATWITSLSFTSITASTTLVTTTPVWVSLISWIWFQEKLTKQTILGIMIALTGGIIIAVGGNTSTQFVSNSMLGNGLALVGAWMASLYLIWGRKAQEHGFRVGNYIAIAYTTAALVLFPFPLLMENGYLGYPQQVYLYVGLMAIFSQLVGHTIFNWALRWISPTLVTLTILFEPVGSSFLGFVFFGEVPPFIVLGGGIMLLIGIIMAVLGSKKDHSVSEEGNKLD